MASVASSYKIAFGTDGWRGVIGEDFTFANARRVAAGIAAYVRAQGDPDRCLVIGYDTRFLSPESARIVADVVASAGIAVILADGPTPTPALSYAAVARKTAGAIVITASHNPCRWNGVKFKAPYGGSAAPWIMKSIEAHLPDTDPLPTCASQQNRAAIETADLVSPYLERLKSMIHLERIRASGHRFVIDPMYGAGRGCIAQLFEEERITYREIHAERNPLFPGLNPEPIEPHVSDLRAAVLETGFDAGLATDGDADRIGAIDRDGTFIDSHKIFSILLKHLAEDLKLRGEVVKTFSTTRMVDKLAAKYDLPLHITPIGFKYICELMLARDVLIGGEESGGICIKGHLPERDGILNSLLLAEVMAEKGKTLGELVRELEEEFGPHCYGRVDIEIERDGINRLIEQVQDQNYRRVADLEMTGRDNLDGCKMLFGDSAWLLVRASGTENVIRFYAEAPSQPQVKALLDAMVTLARGEK
jgi:phosphomannomutase